MKTSIELHSLRNSIFARLLARNIGLNDFRNAAFFVDHSLSLLRPLDIEVNKSNFGTMAGEKNSSGTTVSNLAFSRIVSLCEYGRMSCFERIPFIREPAPVTMATSLEKSKALGGVMLVTGVGVSDVEELEG